MKTLFKKISITSDYAGYKLKEFIKVSLKKSNIELIDLGPHDTESVDYPDFAKKVSKNIRSKKSKLGILVCGSGMGMAMSANKHKNIRAALCYSVKNAKLSRLHNDANVITLGERLISKNLAFKCINTSLNTTFEGGRHLKRVKKI